MADKSPKVPKDNSSPTQNQEGSQSIVPADPNKTLQPEQSVTSENFITPEQAEQIAIQEELLKQKKTAAAKSSAENSVDTDALFSTKYATSQELAGNKKVGSGSVFTPEEYTSKAKPGMEEISKTSSRALPDDEKNTGFHSTLPPHYLITVTTVTPVDSGEPDDVLPAAQSITRTFQEDDNTVSIHLTATDNKGLAGFTFLNASSNGTLWLDADKTKQIQIGHAYTGIYNANNGEMTVYYKPHENWSGTTEFEYTVTDSSGNVSAPAIVSLTVTPVADDPSLLAPDQSGNDDTAISLNISATPNDDSEFISSITISGIPQGATLQNDLGNINVIFTNGIGSITFSGDTIISNLAGLKITPPLHYHGNFALEVTATSQELSDSSQAAQTTSVIHITVVDTIDPDNTATIDHISSDTGAISNDFITNATTFTVTGTLAAGLADDEILEFSIDNGDHWTKINSNEITGTSWSHSMTLAEGTYGFVVRVSDLALNHGPNSPAKQVVIDITDPKQPISFGDISNDTGADAHDRVTKATGFNVNGVLGGALAEGEVLQVRVKDPQGNAGDWITILPQEITPGTTLGTFNFTHEFTGLTQDGKYTFEAQVLDLAGNTTGSIGTQEVTVDTLRPEQTLSITDISPDTGSTGSDYIGTDKDYTTNPNGSSIIVNGTIIGSLASGEQLKISFDNGSTWNSISNISNGNWSYDAGVLTTGTYPVVVKVFDLAGNSTQTGAAQTITVDTVKPQQTLSITDISPDTGSTGSDYIGTDKDYTTNTGTFTINGTIGGSLASNEQLRISLDGGTTWNQVNNISNGTWSYDASNLSEGAHSVMVHVIDTAGNVTHSPPEPLIVTVDSLAPQQTLLITGISAENTALGNEYFTKMGTFTINGTINSSIGPDEELHISLDGGTTWNPVNNISNGTWSYAVSNIGEGSHSVIVHVIDTAGNVTLTPAVKTVTVDNLSPSDVVTVTFNDGMDLADGAQTMYSTVTAKIHLVSLEPHGVLEVKIDNGDWIAVNSSSLTAANGGGYDYALSLDYSSDTTPTFHTVAARVTDLVGNSNAGASSTVYVDTVGPDQTLTITQVQNADPTKTGLYADDNISQPDSFIVSGTISGRFMNGYNILEIYNGEQWTDITDKISVSDGVYTFSYEDNFYHDRSFTYSLRITDSFGRSTPDLDKPTYAMVIDDLSPPVQNTNVSFYYVDDVDTQHQTLIEGTNLTHADTIMHITVTLNNGEYLVYSPDGTHWYEVSSDGIQSQSGLSLYSYQHTGSTYTIQLQFENMAQGPHNYDFRIVDVAGNQSATIASGSFYLDSIAPTVDDVTATADEGQHVVLTLSAHDEMPGSQLSKFILTSYPTDGTLWLDEEQTERAYLNHEYSTNDSGNFVLYFFPDDLNWSGTTTFNYIAEDNFHNRSTQQADVHVNLTPVADVPNLGIQGSPNLYFNAHPSELNLGSTLGGGNLSDIRTLQFSGIPVGSTLYGVNGQTLAITSSSPVSVDPSFWGNSLNNIMLYFPSSLPGASQSITVKATNADTTTNTVEAYALAALEIPFNITASLTDTDNSEILSLQFSGLPIGSILYGVDTQSSITVTDNNTITVPQAFWGGSISYLKLYVPSTVPDNSYEVHITPISNEKANNEPNGQAAGETKTINVVVDHTPPTVDILELSKYSNSVLTDTGYYSNSSYETFTLLLKNPLPEGMRIQISINGGDYQDMQYSAYSSLNYGTYMIQDTYSVSFKYELPDNGGIVSPVIRVIDAAGNIGTFSDNAYYQQNGHHLDYRDFTSQITHVSPTINSTVVIKSVANADTTGLSANDFKVQSGVVEVTGRINGNFVQGLYVLQVYNFNTGKWVNTDVTVNSDGSFIYTDSPGLRGSYAGQTSTYDYKFRVADIFNQHGAVTTKQVIVSDGAPTQQIIFTNVENSLDGHTTVNTDHDIKLLGTISSPLADDEYLQFSTDGTHWYAPTTLIGTHWTYQDNTQYNNNDTVSYVARIINAVGNSTLLTPITITIAITPPPLSDAQVNIESISNDTGSRSDDFITNSTTTPTIRGTLTDAYDGSYHVQVSLDGGQNWVNADPSLGAKTWSYTPLSGNFSQNYTIKVQLLDIARNQVLDSTDTQDVIVDTIAPGNGGGSFVNIYDSTGSAVSLNVNNPTYYSSVRLEGYNYGANPTDPNDTSYRYSVRVNGGDWIPVETYLDNGNRFRVNNVTLSPTGNSTIQFGIVDKAGNYSLGDTIQIASTNYQNLTNDSKLTVAIADNTVKLDSATPLQLGITLNTTGALSGDILVKIEGLPSGSILSNGSQSITLSDWGHEAVLRLSDWGGVEGIAKLHLLPPLNASGNFNITITAYDKSNQILIGKSNSVDIDLTIPAERGDPDNLNNTIVVDNIVNYGGNVSNTNGENTQNASDTVVGPGYVRLYGHIEGGFIPGYSILEVSTDGVNWSTDYLRVNDTGWSSTYNSSSSSGFTFLYSDPTQHASSITQNYYFRVTDPDHNFSPISAQAVVVDATPPNATITSVQVDDYYHVGNDIQYNKNTSTQVRLEGVVSPLEDGAYIQVTVDGGNTWHTVAMSDATHWTYTDPTIYLSSTNVTYSYRVVDATGNAGESSDFVVDVEPQIVITAATVSGAAYAFGNYFSATDPIFTISGKIDPSLARAGATIGITFDAGSSYQFATINNDGTWSYTATSGSPYYPYNNNNSPFGGSGSYVLNFSSKLFNTSGSDIELSNQNIIYKTSSPNGTVENYQVETLSHTPLSSGNETEYRLVNISGQVNSLASSPVGGASDYVQISIDGTTWLNAQMNGSNWSFSSLMLPVGDVTIQARVVSWFGVPSNTNSEIIHLTVQSSSETAPNQTVTFDIYEGTSTTGAQLTDSSNTTKANLYFSGHIGQALSADQFLQISTDGGSTWYTVTSFNDLAWSYQYTQAKPMNDGHLVIETRVIDKQGQTSDNVPDPITIGMDNYGSVPIVESIAASDGTYIISNTFDGNAYVNIQSFKLTITLVQALENNNHLAISTDGGINWTQVYASADGRTYIADSNGYNEGVYNIKIYQMDSSGNQIGDIINVPQILQVDITAPDSISGTVRVEDYYHQGQDINYTLDTSPQVTLEGKLDTALPQGYTIQVSTDGNNWSNATIISNTRWSYTDPTLYFSDTSVVYYYRVVDIAGNASAPNSASISIAPELYTFEIANTVSGSGSNNFIATNTSALSISGTANDYFINNSHYRLEISINGGEWLRININNNGTWSYSLSDGNNPYQNNANDQLSVSVRVLNISNSVTAQQSELQHIYYDTQPSDATLTINPIANGITDSYRINISGTVGPLNDSGYGLTDKVQISLDHGATWQDAVVNNGIWSVSNVLLTAGIDITVQARILGWSGTVGQNTANTDVKLDITPEVYTIENNQFVALAENSTINKTDLFVYGTTSGTFGPNEYLRISFDNGDNWHDITDYSDATHWSYQYNAAADDAALKIIVQVYNSSTDMGTVILNPFDVNLDVTGPHAPDIQEVTITTVDGSTNYNIGGSITIPPKDFTIGITLNTPLASGDVLKISFDGGNTWNPMNFADSSYSYAVNDPAVAHYNYLIKAFDALGNASDAITQPVVIGNAASSVVQDIQFIGVQDYLIAPDGIYPNINGTPQVKLLGTLTTTLGADQHIEVSKDGGTTWDRAHVSVNGLNWSYTDPQVYISAYQPLNYSYRIVDAGSQVIDSGVTPEYLAVSSAGKAIGVVLANSTEYTSGNLVFTDHGLEKTFDLSGTVDSSLIDNQGYKLQIVFYNSTPEQTFDDIPIDPNNGTWSLDLDGYDPYLQQSSGYIYAEIYLWTTEVPPAYVANYSLIVYFGDQAQTFPQLIEITHIYAGTDSEGTPLATDGTGTTSGSTFYVEGTVDVENNPIANNSGTILQIKFFEGDVWHTTTFDSATGAWSYAFNGFFPEATTLNIQERLIDSSGNIGAVTEPIVINYVLPDTTAPTVNIDTTMVGDDVDPATSIGHLADNKIYVNSGDFTITISLAQALGAGEKLQISFDNGVNWDDLTPVSDPALEYAYTFSSVSEGEHIYSYQVRGIDAANNISSPISASQTIVVDTTPPDHMLEIKTVVDGARNSVSENGYTQASTLNISGTIDGTLQAGESIQVKVGSGSWQTAHNNGDGTWTIVLTGLSSYSGLQSIQTRVIDLAHNTNSTNSNDSYYINFGADPDPATIAITNIYEGTDTNGNSLTGSNGVYYTKETSLLITGETQGTIPPHKHVQISIDGGTTWADVTPTVGNAWSYQYTNTNNEVRDNLSTKVRLIDDYSNVPSSVSDGVTLHIDNTATIPIIETMTVVGATPDNMNGNQIYVKQTNFTVRVTLSSDLYDEDNLVLSVFDSTNGWADVGIMSQVGSTNVYTLSFTGTAGTEYSYRLRTEDAVGNVSAEVDAPNTVIIDNTNPVAEVAAISVTDSNHNPIEQNYYTSASSIIVTVSLTDVINQSSEKVQVRIGNSGAWTTATHNPDNSWSANINGVSNIGQKTIEARVVDFAGNASDSATFSVTFGADSKPPEQTVTIDHIYMGTSDNDLELNSVQTTAKQLFITGSITGDALSSHEHLQISLDGGQRWTEITPSGSGWSYAYNNTQTNLDITLDIRLRVIDDANNLINGVNSQIIHIDNIATPVPVITDTSVYVDQTLVTASSGNLLYVTDNTYTLKVTLAQALDDQDSLILSISDGQGGWTELGSMLAGSNNTYSYEITGSGGVNYNYQIITRDAANNESSPVTLIKTIVINADPIEATVTISTVVDSAHPTVAVEENYYSQATSVKVSGTLTGSLQSGDFIEVGFDGIHWVRADLNSSNPSQITWTAELSGFSNGNTTIQARVSDRAGNHSAADTYSFIFGPDTAPPEQTVSEVVIHTGTDANAPTLTDNNTDATDLFITGRISAALGSHEHLEISFNGGTSWIPITNFTQDNKWTIGHAIGTDIDADMVIKFRLIDDYQNVGLSGNVPNDINIHIDNVVTVLEIAAVTVTNLQNHAVYSFASNQDMYANEQNFKLTITLSQALREGDQLKICIDGVWQSTSMTQVSSTVYEYTINNATQSSHSYAIRTVNDNGHVSNSVSIGNSFVVDATPPTNSITEVNINSQSIPMNPPTETRLYVRDPTLGDNDSMQISLDNGITWVSMLHDTTIGIHDWWYVDLTDTAGSNSNYLVRAVHDNNGFGLPYTVNGDYNNPGNAADLTDSSSSGFYTHTGSSKAVIANDNSSDEYGDHNRQILDGYLNQNLTNGDRIRITVTAEGDIIPRYFYLTADHIVVEEGTPDRYHWQFYDISSYYNNVEVNYKVDIVDAYGNATAVFADTTVYIRSAELNTVTLTDVFTDTINANFDENSATYETHPGDIVLAGTLALPLIYGVENLQIKIGNGSWTTVAVDKGATTWHYSFSSEAEANNTISLRVIDSNNNTSEVTQTTISTTNYSATSGNSVFSVDYIADSHSGTDITFSNGVPLVALEGNYTLHGKVSNELTLQYQVNGGSWYTIYDGAHTGAGSGTTSWSLPVSGSELANAEYNFRTIDSIGIIQSERDNVAHIVIQGSIQSADFAVTDSTVSGNNTIYNLTISGQISSDMPSYYHIQVSTGSSWSNVSVDNIAHTFTYNTTITVANGTDLSTYNYFFRTVDPSGATTGFSFNPGNTYLNANVYVDLDQPPSIYNVDVVVDSVGPAALTVAVASTDNYTIVNNNPVLDSGTVNNDLAVQAGKVAVHGTINGGDFINGFHVLQVWDATTNTWVNTNVTVNQDDTFIYYDPTPRHGDYVGQVTTYTYQFRIVDAYDRASGSFSKTVTVDDQAPTQTVALTTTDYVSVGDIEAVRLHGTVNSELGNNYVQVSFDGGITWQLATITDSTHWTFTDPRTHNDGDTVSYKVRVADAVGNGGTPASISLTVDLPDAPTPPAPDPLIVIESISPDTGVLDTDFITNATDTNFTISGYFNGNISDYTFETSPNGALDGWSSGTLNIVGNQWTYTGHIDFSNYTFYIRALDGNGQVVYSTRKDIIVDPYLNPNGNAMSLSFNSVEDKAGITISSNSATDYSTVTVNGRVQFSQSDQLIQYKVNNGDWHYLTIDGDRSNAIDFQITDVELISGANQITMRVTDPAGNTNALNNNDYYEISSTFNVTRHDYTNTTQDDKLAVTLTHNVLGIVDATPIALGLNITNEDSYDPSTIKVHIAGLPEGATLSNADGSKSIVIPHGINDIYLPLDQWGDITGLKLTVSNNTAAGEYPITVNLIHVDGNGNSVGQSASQTLYITAEADRNITHTDADIIGSFSLTGVTDSAHHPIAQYFNTLDSTIIVSGAISHALASDETLLVRVGSGDWSPATLLPGGLWSVQFGSLNTGAQGQTIEAKIVDGLGNASSIQSYDIYFGNYPDTPTQAVDIDSIGGVISGTINGSLQNYQHLRISIDGGANWHDLTPVGNTWSYNVGAIDQDVTIQLQVIDNAGHESPNVPESVNTHIDTLATVPVVDTFSVEVGGTSSPYIDGSTTSVDSKTFVVKVTLVNALDSQDTLEISSDGINWTTMMLVVSDTSGKTYMTSDPITVSIDRPYNYSIRTSDVAGNISNPVSIGGTVLVDTKAPIQEASELTFNDTAIAVSTEVRVYARDTLLDTNDSMQISFDGGTTWVSMMKDTTLNVSDLWYADVTNTIHNGDTYLIRSVYFNEGIAGYTGFGPISSVTVGSDPHPTATNSSNYSTPAIYTAFDSQGAIVINDDHLTLSGQLNAPLADNEKIRISIQATQDQAPVYFYLTNANLTQVGDHYNWTFTDGRTYYDNAQLHYKVDIIDSAGHVTPQLDYHVTMDVDGQLSPITVTVAGVVTDTINATNYTGVYGAGYLASSDSDYVIYGTLSQALATGLQKLQVNTHPYLDNDGWVDVYVAPGATNWIFSDAVRSELRSDVGGDAYSYTFRIFNTLTNSVQSSTVAVVYDGSAVMPSGNVIVDHVENDSGVIVSSFTDLNSNATYYINGYLANVTSDVLVQYRTNDDAPWHTVTVTNGYFSISQQGLSITSLSDLTDNFRIVSPVSGTTVHSGSIDLSQDNTLIGTANNDILYSGAGIDTLTGGQGNDILIGGKGSDTMAGGTGVDHFVWQTGDDGTVSTPAVDHITDFNMGPGGDILDFSGLFQVENPNDFVNHLSFSYDGNNTIISIDPSGMSSGPTQKVVLENVDLTSGGAHPTANDIITQLVNNHQLIAQSD